MNDDPFSGVNAQPGDIKPPPKKKGKQQYKQAAPVSRLQTQKATGDSAGMHGFYKQANFRLKPEMLDEIDEWARKLKCNKSQLKRYLAWRGLQALKDGERPEYEENNTIDLVDY